MDAPRSERRYTIPPMRGHWRQRIPGLLLGLAGLLAGALVIVRVDIAQRREQFLAEAQTAYRLLSQRAAQHDAILDTLVLLSPRNGDPSRPDQRLAALYPQMLNVLRRDEGGSWPDAALQQAEGRSRTTRRPEIARVDAQAGRFVLLQAGPGLAFALVIDVRRMIPWQEWPIEQGGPVQVILARGDETFVVQPGEDPVAQPAGLTQGFTFAKPLASASQPFELRLRRATGPAQWPWAVLLAWLVLVSAAAAGTAAWWNARRARGRAEQLLRLAQAARLNAMGELAAGLAHELNQPLTAVMANAQAARRLLDDETPRLDVAQAAMERVAEQARRASDVLGRLRRRMQMPQDRTPTQPVQLADTARQVLHLIEPEIRRRGVRATIEGHAPPVQADPVALEQIVHNLVNNAMTALEQVPETERRLVLQLSSSSERGILSVHDSGPGITADALPRLFEPFYSTRPGGLGLGLSLSETLALAMEGTLSADNIKPRGAAFRLALPLAGLQAQEGA
jgi:signal transduction histidine kinase